MSSVSSPVVQHRIVPGAPHPAPSSKSQKKKRKTPAKSADGDHVDIPDTPAASQIEFAPSSEDIKAGSVAPQLLSQPEEIPEAATPALDGAYKNSPLAEMVSKRMKATNKKIVCVFLPNFNINRNSQVRITYSCAFRVTLPILRRSSTMIKSAPSKLSPSLKVFTRNWKRSRRPSRFVLRHIGFNSSFTFSQQHEAEDNREIALKQAQAAQAEQQRINDAVAAAEVTTATESNCTCR